MGSRIGASVVFCVVVTALLGVHLLAASLPPAPMAISCTLRYRQPGTGWTNVTSVNRAQAPATYYDYYNASAHTEFVQAYVSKAYFYKDTATGKLYFFVHHNIDEAGATDATVDFDFSALPAGVAVQVSDDPGEFQLGRSPEAQWQFWLNTDGGALGPFPANSWSFTITSAWGGADPMTSWRFVDGSGTHHALDMAKSLEVANACNQSPTANAGGPYEGLEGSPVAFNASLSSDPDGNPLTYRWDFESDGTWDTAWSPVPVATHTWGDDWTGNATVEVSDGQFTAISRASVTVRNVAPVVEAGEDRVVGEATTLSVEFTFTDPGFDSPPAGTSEDFSATVDWGYGPPEGAGIEETPGSAGTPTRGTIALAHAYGDNGVFTVRVTVCDDDGGCGADSTDVTVDNVLPALADLQAYAVANLTLRVAGERWHDVRMDIVRDGTVTGTAQVVRYPGSPDEQAATIHGERILLVGATEVVVYYTPDDDPINGQPNGANPAWVILAFADGTEVRIHHTFDVQHPDTWTWNLGDVRSRFVGKAITFEATSHDVGSDDLTFAWSFGDGSASHAATYYNDGMGPDPVRSPELNPITARDVASHAFLAAGAYTVTLSVTDDDGGVVSVSLVITIP